MKIMIVDDVEMNILRLKDVVKGMGQIEGFQRAEDGLAALHSAYNTGQPYDLLLLDVMMPGMNGLDFLKAATGAGQSIPVERKTKIIMVTSKGDADCVRRAVEGGASGYILRPFRPERVLMEIQKLFPPVG